jgi:hypothetical protein
VISLYSRSIFLLSLQLVIALSHTVISEAQRSTISSASGKGCANTLLSSMRASAYPKKFPDSRCDVRKRSILRDDFDAPYLASSDGTFGCHRGMKRLRFLCDRKNVVNDGRISVADNDTDPGRGESCAYGFSRR